MPYNLDIGLPDTPALRPLPSNAKPHGDMGLEMRSTFMQPAGTTIVLARGDRQQIVKPISLTVQLIEESWAALDVVYDNWANIWRNTRYIERSGWWRAIAAPMECTPAFATNALQPVYTVTMTFMPVFPKWTADRVATRAEYNGTSKRAIVTKC